MNFSTQGQDMTGRGQDSSLPQFIHQPIYDPQLGIQIERCSYASTDPHFQFGGAGCPQLGLRTNAGTYQRDLLGSSNMPFTELLSNMHPPPGRDCLEAVVGVPFMTHQIGANFFEADAGECCTDWRTSDNSFLPGQAQTGPSEVSQSFELYDLNLPPAFAPITPEKATREHRQGVSEVETSAMNSYCYHNRRDEQNQQRNVSVNIDIGYSCPPQCSLQNPATESSLVARASENNTDTVLLSETPQLKQRRKKHRPKVITERKPRKQKPAEEKPTSAQDKSTTAQDKPTGKRKYVRRNKLTAGLATPLGDTNEETVQRKTKYTRKKNVSEEPAAATTDETEVGTSDVEVLEPTKKTCRRALNFNMDELQPKKSSPNNSQFIFGSQNLAKQQNGSTSTIGCSNVLKMREQTIEVGIGCSITGSRNLVEKDSLLLPEQAPRTPLPPKNRQQGGLIAPSQRKKYTSEIYGKTNTGQANINNSTCILKEKNASELNACSLSTDEQVDATRTNFYGSLYNSLLAYKAAFQQQLLPNQKRKRSEKGKLHASSPTAIRSSLSRGAFFIDNRMSVHGSAVSGFEADIGVTERKDYNGKLQAHVLEQANNVRKKRSKGNTRIRDDFASLNVMRSFTEAQTGRNANTETSCTSMGELLAKMDSKLAKKKRTKKSPITPAYSSNDEKRRIIISNQNGFPTNYIGPPEVMWNQIYSIDAIIEMLRHLQICKEVSNAPYQQSAALIPYNMGRYDSALVPYREGTIILFDPAKKRRPRPKVDLDEETNRVWKLLLGNINSEGIDGNDDDKAKWWEEERRVFRGRADSFIARMHLVQGDRRFSPWKGSVVDSVVGVFLTQNVSDHLSSSAFMSMAAHFPVKQKGKGIFCENGTSLAVLGPKYYVSDPEEISKCNENESVRQIGDQSSMTLHSFGQLEREADDSNESSVCGINSSGSIYESRQELPHSSGICFSVYNHCRQNGSITDRTAWETEFSKRDEATDEALSQNSVISSQDSADFPIVQTVETTAHYTQDSGREEQPKGSKISFPNDSTFVELLQMFGSNMQHDVYVHDTYRSHVLEGTRSLNIGSLNIGASEDPKCLLSGKNILSTEYHGHANVNTDAELLDMFKEQRNTIQTSNTKDVNSLKQQSPVTEESICQSGDLIDSTISNPEMHSSANNQLNYNIHQKKNMKIKGKRQLLGGNGNVVESSAQRQNMKSKSKKAEKEAIEWDYLRKQVESSGKKRERTERSMDSVDWEAVRCADVDEIAQTIKERGMNNMLAERIKDFLNRLVSDHGSIDLEWLRDVPPDKAKEYLLSVRGLGLKSVECVRLLTLHHLAFPVDTNVGRIAVRLGWVPLQPLPESLQLHLLELYPILESIQKYLWPRLCKLDQRTLYELHYQMITFGKVFCTKSKPNCNACPMRGECRHFASAFASARLALPGPEEKGIIIANESRRPDQNHTIKNPQALLLPQLTEQPEGQQLQARYAVANCEPIIEEPATPEPECMQAQEVDIEDTFCVDDGIPKIELNMEQLSQNLQAYVENNMGLQESDLSKALVALTAEAASMPAPKLKNISRLRTEHHVYELPDSHPLLNGMDKREADDPCKYLLAIWTPGETPNSIQPPEKSCSSQEHGFLCMEKTCFSCNSKREAESQIVRGTLLIPCRTAMRGSFPLNGTYFQVNEVFADHKSSLNPIEVPRNWLWNLPRRTVYFGTSIPTIFKGLTTEGIQHCFWRGFVCVRGFDHQNRAPRPLIARLHFPASKMAKGKGRGADDE